jgi:integrase
MTKSANIVSKSARAALLARREPYWARIQGGLYLGYRKLKVGEGTWIARRQSGKRKQYFSLGTFTDVRAFDSATEAAKLWLRQLEDGVSSKPLTVADACREYVDNLKARKSQASSNDANGRFERLVYTSNIGNVLLSKLKTTDVKAWLNAQVNVDADEDEVRRDRDSANRNLSSLKAALNLALRDRLVSTDAGWKTVNGFSDVGRRRIGFLTLTQRDALLAKCPADLGNLVKAMLLTAARPGELAKLAVKDFDKAQGTIELTGKTGRREATLSTAAIQFFTEISKDRIGVAPLLAREHGARWDKDSWKGPFRDAARAAGLPSSTVMYTLRHIAITELVNGGMDSFVVAKLAGTSTAMIDKHYGQLRHDRTRSRLDAVQML